MCFVLRFAFPPSSNTKKCITRFGGPNRPAACSRHEGNRGFDFLAISEDFGGHLPQRLDPTSDDAATFVLAVSVAVHSFLKKKKVPKLTSTRPHCFAAGKIF